MIKSKKKKEVEEEGQEKVPPVKSLHACADAEQVSTFSTGELNLTKNDSQVLTSNSETVEKQLRDHIKNKWSSIINFSMNETVSSKMLGNAVESKMVGVLPNISNTAFCEFFKNIVSKSLSKLRHNSQILARKNKTGKNIVQIMSV
eukprot:8215550-Ditylum_brightwellii.AAC.1